MWSNTCLGGYHVRHIVYFLVGKLEDLKYRASESWWILKWGRERQSQVTCCGLWGQCTWEREKRTKLKKNVTALYWDCRNGYLNKYESPLCLYMKIHDSYNTEIQEVNIKICMYIRTHIYMYFFKIAPLCYNKNQYLPFNLICILKLLVFVWLTRLRTVHKWMIFKDLATRRLFKQIAH